MHPKAYIAPQPAEIRPMLPTLVKEAPQGEDWLHEIKYDGYRILCQIRDGQVRLYSRNHQDMTRKFPALGSAVGKLVMEDAVLDGEVVVLDSRGKSDFQGLQNYLKGLTGEVPVFYVFDLPWYGGYNLSGVPLLRRKELLEELLNRKDGEMVRFSHHIRGYGPQMYENACRMALEGIISKNVYSRYEPGRTRNWFKVKCTQHEEFYICGYTCPQGGRAYFGALVLGVYFEGGLLYCGRVGTGFSHKTLVELSAHLARLQRDDSPLAHPLTRQESRDVTWVDPCLLARVAFTEKTREGLLRHPSFLSWREKKEGAHF